MSSKLGVGSLGGSASTGGVNLKALLANGIGRVTEKPDKLSSSMLVAPLDPAPPISDDPELSAISSLFERLLSLLALLFLSFPPPERIPNEALPLASLLPLRGGSISKPYCSKDRLKDVPFSA